MNLTTVSEVRPAVRLADAPLDWRDGDGWLAGGTWLFSEPQPHLRRLFDLHAFGWEPLTADEDGLTIAATCTIRELAAATVPPDWTAAPLVDECCRAFLASFKIWNASTVGGNVCMSLPASPMVSLVVALEAQLLLWPAAGGERRVAAEEFVTGNHANVLAPGELLRAIEIPATALRKRAAFRRMSLTHLGRSSVLLAGTLDAGDGAFRLTVSAATVRPVVLRFAALPDARGLRERIGEAIPDDLYHDDVHGAPDYRNHMTLYFAEEIRGELAAAAAA